MTLWLRRASVFACFAALDSGDGAVRLCEANAVPPRKVARPDGHFEMLGDVFAGFYVEDGRILVRLGSLTVAPSSDIAFLVGGRPERRWFVIERNGEPLASADYRLPREQMFADDPTPFVEPEHFDFGLFVKSVCESPERQAIMIEVTREP